MDTFDGINQDEAMRSCGIAGQTIMLAANAKGGQLAPSEVMVQDRFA